MFKVAKYGQVRGTTLETQDWSKNRANSRVEHDILVSWKDQNVSKAVSLAMIDIAHKKRVDMDSGKGVLYAESAQTHGRSRKLTTGDLAGIQSRITEETRAEDPNNIINGEVAQHTAGKVPVLDSQVMEKIIIDPAILNFIASINRKMTPREMDDLREQILQSAEDHGVMIQQSNAANPNQNITNDLLWESVANYIKGASMKTINYGKTRGSVIIEGAKNHAYKFEQYKFNSKISGQRRGNIQNPDLYVPESTKYDNEYGKEVQANKMVGVMGTKYMRRFMDRDRYETDLVDTTARTKM
jgi:hypothetical protein